MKNQNENAAVSDVTARMREEASILSLLNGQSVGVASVAKKLREFADSIDAAVSKTETTTPGNAAAMREALEKIVAIPVLDEECQCPECDRQRTVRDIARAALAAPPRNCDVGTAKEQARRFSFFCTRYHGCGKCNLNKGRKDCKFTWAQMPYEAGEGDVE